MMVMKELAQMHRRMQEPSDAFDVVLKVHSENIVVDVVSNMLGCPSSTTYDQLPTVPPSSIYLMGLTLYLVA